MPLVFVVIANADSGKGWHFMGRPLMNLRYRGRVTFTRPQRQARLLPRALVVRSSPKVVDFPTRGTLARV